jgi:hypothetical protein
MTPSTESSAPGRTAAGPHPDPLPAPGGAAKPGSARFRPAAECEAFAPAVLSIGDPPIGQIAIRFVVDGCPYSLWLSGEDDEGDQRGYPLGEAVGYARRF